ncbi:hypothetical protein [Nocardia albiluteola]|nr:hypothetical protein [Nocardia albiluteola]
MATGQLVHRFAFGADVGAVCFGPAGELVAAVGWDVVVLEQGG